MRRSKKQEQKRKRNNLIGGLVIIFLMLFSILAFPMNSTTPTQGTFTYNNHTFEERIIFDEIIFQQDIRKYFTQINQQEISFYNTPTQTQRINVTEENLSNIQNAQTITFSRQPIQNEELNINIFFFDVIRIEYAINTEKNIQQGITEHAPLDDELEVINCENATQTNPIIKLSKEINTPRIHEVEPHCFEVTGDGQDLLMISDYLIYKTHNII